MPLSKYVNLKKNKIEYENPFTDTETKWCLLTKVFHKKQEVYSVKTERLSQFL